MSLRDRMERRAYRLAEDARALRMDTDFRSFSASGSGVLTMTDVDLERTSNELALAKKQVDRVIADRAAAQAEARALVTGEL